MENRKIATPTWVWELRSRTKAFLKKRSDYKEIFMEYIYKSTKVKSLDIEKFIHTY